MYFASLLPDMEHELGRNDRVTVLKVVDVAKEGASHCRDHHPRFRESNSLQLDFQQPLHRLAPQHTRDRDT
jgi:hypothetical protein